MLHQKICQLNVKGQQGLALLTPSLLWQFSSVTKCDAFFLSLTQPERIYNPITAMGFWAM